MTLREGRLRCELRVAAASGDDAETADVELVAYTGGLINVGFGPEVVDLEGLTHKASIPLLIDHEQARIAGYSTTIDNDKKRLLIKGKLLVGEGEEEGRRVRKRAKAGFPYQASMGWRVLEDELVPAGQTRVVNGQAIAGPFVHDKRSELFETSVLSLGADSNTTVRAAGAATTTTHPGTARQENGMTEIEKERARVKDLRTAFAKDTTFALEAIDAGWSVVEAKAQYSDRQAAQLETERAARAKAEADLAAEKSRKASATTGTTVPAVRPAGERTASAGDEEAPAVTATERFGQLVEKARAAGMSRSDAVKHVAKTNAEEHRAMLLEANPGKAEPAYRAGRR